MQIYKILFFSQKLEMQEQVAGTFVRTFQLTQEELTAIKGASRDDPITPNFFLALEKTQTIRNNTKYLLQVSSI